MSEQWRRDRWYINNGPNWTNENELRLTELHDKLEANGFKRSKLPKTEQMELLELEQKWTDIYDFSEIREFPYFT
jgi:hypothetical protein